MNSRQLTKSSKNRMVSGVIAGICEYFGWSSDVVTILRILFIILAFSSMGGLIPLYFVASWIIPSGYHRRGYDDTRDERDYQSRWDEKAARFEEKMNRKKERYEEKASRYNNSWSQRNSWDEVRSDGRKIKDAEPVKKETEDDWSDF